MRMHETKSKHAGRFCFGHNSFLFDVNMKLGRNLLRPGCNQNGMSVNTNRHFETGLSFAQLGRAGGMTLDRSEQLTSRSVLVKKLL